MNAMLSVPNRDGKSVQVDLPPGSAAWLYHLCAIRADSELNRDDLDSAQLAMLFSIRQESAIMRDFLLMFHPEGIDVFGGSAETALACLDWASSEHQRTAESSGGKMREAVLARAATMRRWTEIAQDVVAPSDFRLSLMKMGSKLSADACALYAALINGAVRFVAQAGSQAVPILAVLTADLQIFARVEDSRQRITGSVGSVL